MEDLLANWGFYENLLKAAGAIGGFLVSFAAIWWKISRALVSATLKIEHLEKSTQAMAESNLELTKAIVQLSTRIDEREKGMLKLEGVVDAQRKDLIHVISSLQQSTSSMDAMWRTLQKIFPEKVPQRASDRA